MNKEEKLLNLLSQNLFSKRLEDLEVFDKERFNEIKLTYDIINYSKGNITTLTFLKKLLIIVMN